MFPLETVLFPAMPLPLHVFEPRYRALTKDCLAGNGEFGVVLIERGSEVGGGDERYAVGTVARIVQAAELPDGRWLLGAVGVRRVAVDEWLPADPYPAAMVRDLPEAPLAAADGDILAHAERLVRRALALKSELDEPGPSPTTELASEPPIAAYQLAAMAPLGPADRQRLLEEETPAARLRALVELLDEEVAVLAHRLAGG